MIITRCDVLAYGKVTSSSSKYVRSGRKFTVFLIVIFGRGLPLGINSNSKLCHGNEKPVRLLAIMCITKFFVLCTNRHWFNRRDVNILCREHILNESHNK
jgi:hypothetical protein